MKCLGGKTGIGCMNLARKSSTTENECLYENDTSYYTCNEVCTSNYNADHKLNKLKKLVNKLSQISGRDFKMMKQLEVLKELLFFYSARLEREKNIQDQRVYLSFCLILKLAEVWQRLACKECVSCCVEK